MVLINQTVQLCFLTVGQVGISKINRDIRDFRLWFFGSRLLHKLLGYLSKVAPKIFKSCPKVAFYQLKKISFYY